MNAADARALLDDERRRLESTRDALRCHAGPTGGSQRDDTGELSSMDEHVADIASDTLEREVDVAVLHSIETELAAIDSALHRLSTGAFGRCEVCGDRIAEARLRALPTATRCLADQISAELVDAAARDAALHDATELEAVTHLDLLPAEDVQTSPPPAEEAAVHLI